MPETQKGIEVMRARMERASRKPPPPRRPRSEEDSGPGAPPAETRAPAPPPRPASARARTPRPEPEPARLAPDLPAVNLAIRVRRPLDDRLAELIHALRRQGVRTSKVELIEMLLWETPAEPERVRERLGRFRRWAPRGAAAPLGEGEGAPPSG